MREIYFHEDDYCQQQLLPHGAAEHAGDEVQKIQEFADAHRDPNGIGWTDIYVREQGPLELCTLKMRKEELALAVESFLPAFDIVYTGYSSHRELCKRTMAWGRAQRCALFADWDDNGLVRNIWTEFFERDEELIRAATKAIAGLGQLHPLVYVDWAWGYTCAASEEELFASKLRDKLETIQKNKRSFGKG